MSLDLEYDESNHEYPIEDDGGMTSMNDFTNPFKLNDLVVANDEDRTTLVRDWKGFDPDKMHRVIATSKYSVTIIQCDGLNPISYTGCTGLFKYMGNRP